jgi:hypothetical protein
VLDVSDHRVWEHPFSDSEERLKLLSSHHFTEPVALNKYRQCGSTTDTHVWLPWARESLLGGVLRSKLLGVTPALRRHLEV